MLLCIDAVISRRPRVPFEIAWPVGLLLAFDIASPSGMAQTGGLVFFAAVVHFARSKDAIEAWLWAMSLSAACMAGLTLLAPVAGLLPPMYSPEWGVPPAFASERIPALLAWLAIAVHAALAKDRSRAARVLAALSAAVLLGAVALAIPGHSWAGLGTVDQSGLALARRALTLWLVARVAAKIVVERIEAGSGPHAMLFALVAIAGACAVWPQPSGAVPYPFVLGLACAYVLPHTASGKRARSAWALLLAVPVAALVGLNMWRVDMDNASDPRNYDSAGARHFARHDFDGLTNTMRAFGRSYPNERRTHLWLARAELAMGHPHRAAAEFAEATKPVPRARTILPPPSPEERGDFLARLRDRCSSFPRRERGLAYERALLAAGKASEAFHLLEFSASKGGSAGTGVGEDDRAVLEAALAFLLGSEEAKARLRSWPVEDLAALLEHCGAIAETAPDAFPRTCLPLACIARYGAPGECILALGGAGGAVGIVNAPVRASGHGWMDAGWAAPERGESGAWSIVLRLPGSGEVLAVVRIAASPEMAIVMHALPPSGVPDAPAIRIWLDAAGE